MVTALALQACTVSHPELQLGDFDGSVPDGSLDAPSDVRLSDANEDVSPEDAAPEDAMDASDAMEEPTDSAVTCEGESRATADLAAARIEDTLERRGEALELRLDAERRFGYWSHRAFDACPDSLDDDSLAAIPRSAFDIRRSSSVQGRGAYSSPQAHVLEGWIYFGDEDDGDSIELEVRSGDIQTGSFEFVLPSGAATMLPLPARDDFEHVDTAEEGWAYVRVAACMDADGEFDLRLDGSDIPAGRVASPRVSGMDLAYLPRSVLEGRLERENARWIYRGGMNWDGERFEALRRENGALRIRFAGMVDFDSLPAPVNLIARGHLTVFLDGRALFPESFDGAREHRIDLSEIQGRRELVIEIAGDTAADLMLRMEADGVAVQTRDVALSGTRFGHDYATASGADRMLVYSECSEGQRDCWLVNREVEDRNDDIFAVEFSALLAGAGLRSAVPTVFDNAFDAELPTAATFIGEDRYRVHALNPSEGNDPSRARWAYRVDVEPAAAFVASESGAMIHFEGRPDGSRPYAQEGRGSVIVALPGDTRVQSVNLDALAIPLGGIKVEVRVANTEEELERAGFVEVQADGSVEAGSGHFAEVRFTLSSAGFVTPRLTGLEVSGTCVE